jgi:hypothetical protein
VSTSTPYPRVSIFHEKNITSIVLCVLQYQSADANHECLHPTTRNENEAVSARRDVGHVSCSGERKRARRAYEMFLSSAALQRHEDGSQTSAGKALSIQDVNSLRSTTLEKTLAECAV